MENKSNVYIDDVKNELKILKNELIQFFSDMGDDKINDEFYNKLIDYSSQNPEFLSILKLLTILSSKNETELKHYKIKIYKILEKLIDLKEKSLDILSLQQELFNDLNEAIKTPKNNFSIMEFLKTIIKSKILVTIFGTIILIIVIAIIKETDITLYKDILDIVKKIHF